MKSAKENWDKKSLLLYAVTDRAWLNERTLADCVEQSIKGGVSFVQLREKNLDEKSFLEEAFEIKEICRKYKVPFVINDNVEIAKKVDADGVHVGQSDMSSLNVRSYLGNCKIIGVSASTVEEALEAEKNGADYLGVGAVFPTGTKTDAVDVSYDTLKAICQAVKIPVVAIGGIKADNINELSGSGIDGIAVVSAIFANDDIKKASKILRDKINAIV